MISETIVHKCSKCNSENIVKNGKDKKGKQKYHCKDCGCYGTLNPNYGYSDEFKQKVLKSYKERSSMRGVERIFGVSRKTLSKWLKAAHKKNQEL